ncbi:MAG TPA: hypothetical protein VGU68_05620 [Ktedonobacteraceae bacterium]|nr:hypothetical protein [Ktedonobacteraceae bacterium]
MLTRFYQTSSLDVQRLAQSLGDAQQMIVQIKKESAIRFLMGLNKAIGVPIEHLADGYLVKVGAQDWIDKAVVAINPCTSVGGLIGAIDQNKIVHRVMDAIDRLIHEHHPEVQWSDAPKECERCNCNSMC